MKQQQTITAAAGSLVVKDKKTGAFIEVRPSDTAVYLTIQGERVRVYPNVIKNMTRIGATFHALGTVKNRLMQRIR